MKILTAMLLMIAATPVMTEELKVPADSVLIRPVIKYTQMPFDHPAWEPNEDVKKRALKRALNGNRMCCGSIDVSDDPVVTGIISAEEFNEIDAQTPNWEARRKFMDRTFKTTRQQLADNVCERHGMRKVTSANGTSWRCRK